MSWIPPRAVVLVLICLWACVSAAPASALPAELEGWARLDTPHFHLVGNAGEEALLTLGARLERLREVLAEVASDTDFDSPLPVWIYVFEDHHSFAPYKPVTAAQEPIKGYLVPHEHGIYGALDGDPRTAPVRTLYRQYLHWLIHNNFPTLPLWFREGLAEFYSTFEVRGQEARIGLPEKEYLFWLKMEDFGQQAPLARLFERREQSAGVGQGKFLVRSWLLVHYLLVGEETYYRRVRRYVAEVKGGAEPTAAFHRVFEVDLPSLETQLAEYAGRDSFQYLRFSVPAAGELGAVPRPLAPHEVLYHLGDLLARATPERRAEAAVHFRRALEIRPGYGPALAGLGYLAQAAGDDDTAREYYATAAEKNPRDFLIQYLHGDSLLGALIGRPADEEGKRLLLRASTALEESVRLNEEFSPAWARLGYAYALRGDSPAAEVEALSRALELMPDRLDVAANLVRAHARAGDRQGVDAAVERLRALGADAPTLARVREVQLKMDFLLADQLLRRDRIHDAAALFARVHAEIGDPELRREAAGRLDRLERVEEVNRFLESYNEAARLVLEERYETAAEILRALAERARPGYQRQVVSDLLSRLQASATP